MIVCKKGIVDIISDGVHSYFVSLDGSLKRCGGQGDILAGVSGAFMNYASNLQDDVEDPRERAVLAVVAASIVTRGAAKVAFDSKKIAVTTLDILEALPGHIAGLYSATESKL